MYKKPLWRLTNHQFINKGSISIFQQVVDAPTASAVHWHEFYELSFIVAGEGSNSVNGTIYQLNKGSIFLLTPADFHEVAPLADTSLKIYNIIFAEEMLGEELRHLLFDVSRQYITAFTTEEFNRIEAGFSRIWAEMNLEQLGQQLVVRSELTSLLIELVRKCPPLAGLQEQNNHKLAHPAVHKALTYIQHHFREEISLQNVASQVQLNPNYFSECFRKTTGTFFQTYIINLRLSFAASLLQVSQLPVTEICYASGFNTLSHFERFFKQKYKQTPNAYRRNAARSS